MTIFLIIIIWFFVGIILTIVHRSLSKEKIFSISSFGLSLLGPCMISIISASLICDLYNNY